jgi:hypothetical protein
LFATVQKPEDDPAKAAFINKLREISGMPTQSLDAIVEIASRYKRQLLSYADTCQAVDAAVGRQFRDKIQFAMMYYIEAPDPSNRQVTAVVSNWR